jgi:WD40 repeat protein
MLVNLWDAETGQLIRSMDGHARQTPQGYATALYALAVSPDGKLLASGDRVGEVVLWELETGKEIGRLKAPVFYTFDSVKRARAIGGIRSLCFSPDGTKLAVGGIGKVTNVDGFVGPSRVEVWNWQAGEREFVGQDGHKAILNHLAFHPDEPLLIGAGGGDSGGILAFWDLEHEKPIHKAKPEGHLQQFALDMDNLQIHAVGHGGFQVWTFDGEQDTEDRPSLSCAYLDRSKG